MPINRKIYRFKSSTYGYPTHSDLGKSDTMEDNYQNPKTWDGAWAQRKAAVDELNRRIYKKICEFIDFRGREVLELGCGKGTLSFLSRTLGKCRSNTLVDFSEKALILAKSIFKGHSNTKFTKADYLCLPEKKEYDVVFSSGVIEYFRGKKFEEAILKHIALSRDSVVLIASSYTKQNYERSKSKGVYGFWRPVKEEDITKALKGKKIKSVKFVRFDFMYSYTLPKKLPCKESIIKIINHLALPIEAKHGGLLLTIIKV